ncbi:MAG: DUF1634 domain-containing protein [Fibrobacter sp.]|nr:DUF1634 domain-containing protein [Fibrobacter sp.]
MILEKSSTEKSREIFAGKLVRILVLIAACITAAGGIGFLFTSSHHTYNYSHFPNASGSLKTIKSIITGVFSFNYEAIIQLGVLVLISIPVIRVAIFLISFIRERDWIYVAVSAIVMTVLIFSFLGGKV